VLGRPIIIDAAEISPVTVVLKQGNGSTPGASLTFFLFLKPGEQVDGRKFTIGPGQMTGTKPHIHLAQWDGPNRTRKTGTATSNYALRLEFGERQGNKLPGKIFLEMGEHLGTQMAGTFEATIKP
jgi:hypothetical protein